MTKSVPATPTRRPGQFSELHRCLSALALLDQPTSCEQLSDETARFGSRVRVYNTNRALKAIPEFAVRIESSHELLQYEITPRGKLLLRLLDVAKGGSAVENLDLDLPLQ